MQHKIIHINEKKMSGRYDKIQLALNIPVIAAAAALIIIVNVVMKAVTAPVGLYRVVIYAAFGVITYSFLVSFIITLTAKRAIPAHKRNTYIEISQGIIVFSRYEKTVITDSGKREEHIRMWVMKLTDIEDGCVKSDNIIFKGKARYFCMPADWLRYTVSSGGRIEFERWWNDEYGGENIHEVKIHDDYTFSERIVKRVLLCAERERIDEKRREDFKKRMLELAGSIDKKKGLTLKYKDPRRMPREGIKERKW